MPFNPDDLIGVTLNQKYEIKSKIGGGGMGVVYLAQQFSPSRKVAIKVMRPRGQTEDEMYFERFKREAQFIADCHHTNIIIIHEYVEQEGLRYLVMPYINEGKTLLDLLGNGPLSLRDTLRYIQQAAGALDYAHNHLGVVHRDIKPSNFLLDTDGQLILADFGIARTPGSILTRPGVPWGTEEYMAPEVREGRTDIDRRADIYSLGVVLRQMVTGQTPSRLSHLRLPQTMPSAVDVVIQTATAREREDRYQSAGAFAEALRMAIETDPNAPTIGPGNIPPLVSSPRQARPTRSKLSRLVFFGILLVFFLLIGGIIFTLHMSGSLSILFHAPTDTSTSAQQARAMVLLYYNDWNKGDYSDYQAAYNLLDPAWQNEKGHSFAEQLPNYEQTHHSCVTINSTTPGSDGTFQVAITDNAIEDNPPGTGTVIRAYMGYYMVKQEQGSWRLYPHLHPVPTHGICQAP